MAKTGRAMDAAVAYLERSGVLVMEADEEMGTIEAFDGEERVLISVFSKKSIQDDEAAWMAEVSGRLAAESERLGFKGRTDAITLISIAEDRALLRHYRSVSP